MIKQIHLQNYESHKNTIIELVDGTNALIGESEHGKSAILRAVYWVVFNRPAGDNFRSTWGGDTRVTLVLNNGVTVSREKNKEGNYYSIGHVEKGTVKKLSGFNQAVPEEVVKLLGISALNFQTQFDPHYLLPPVSSGEVARKLNDIVDLTIIDTTQANINSNLRNARKQLSATDTGIENLQIDKKRLRWIKEANIDLKEIEKLDNVLDVLKNKEQHLAQVIYAAKESEEEYKRVSYIDNANTDLKEIEKMYQTSIKNRQTKEQIDTLLNSISSMDEKIEKASAYLYSKQKELKDKFPGECPLCGSVIKKQ